MLTLLKLAVALHHHLPITKQMVGPGGENININVQVDIDTSAGGPKTLSPLPNPEPTEATSTEDRDESKIIWEIWKEWSKCSVTCGQGKMTRTRTCRTAPTKDGHLNGMVLDMCPSKIKEYRKSFKNNLYRNTQDCNPEPCRDSPSPKSDEQNTVPWHEMSQDSSVYKQLLSPPKIIFGKWTEWSKCSVTCGGGSMTRTRECKTVSKDDLKNKCPSKRKQFQKNLTHNLYLNTKACNPEPCAA